MKQLLILLIVTTVSLSARSQTTVQPHLVYQFNSLISDFYFWGSPGANQMGFVATFDGSLNRTSDGGQSWNSVFTATIGDYVSNLTFKDSLEGWAIGGTTSIHTTDGGITWQTLLINGATGYSIHYVPASGYLFSEVDFSNNFFSSDQGKSWLANTRGVAMFSGVSEVATIKGPNFDDLSAVSSDGGITWNDKTIAHGIPMGIGEGLFSFGDNYRDTAFFSSDMGLTWQKRGVVKDFDCDGECCEWGYTLSPFVVGGSGVLYTYDEEYAVYFSTDTGWTWQAICLPVAYHTAGSGISGQVLMDVSEPLIYIVVGKDLFAIPDRPPRSGIAISEGPNPIVRDTCLPNSPVINYISTTGYCAEFEQLGITGSPAFTLEEGYSGLYTSGDTDFHSVKYFSTRVGYDTAYLHIQYFMRCENELHDTTITLYGETRGVSLYNLCLRQKTITTSPGDTIYIPVYLTGNATLGSTSLTIPFQLDTNVLSPIGFQPTLAGITVGSLSYSSGTEIVSLQSGGLTLNGDTLIGYLRCIPYLADRLVTSVSLANSNGTSVNSPCSMLSPCTDSVNIAITGCGTATLLQFMKSGKIPLAIQSIVPNPAADEITVWVAAVGDHHAISYQVIDVLGTVRAEGVVDDRSSGGDELTLDVHSLANGLYYLRVRDVETGVAVSGRFMVNR